MMCTLHTASFKTCATAVSAVPTWEDSLVSRTADTAVAHERDVLILALAILAFGSSFDLSRLSSFARAKESAELGIFLHMFPFENFATTQQSSHDLICELTDYDNGKHAHFYAYSVSRSRTRTFLQLGANCPTSLEGCRSAACPPLFGRGCGHGSSHTFSALRADRLSSED